MRIEYIAIGFILVLLVLLVSLSMLKGIVPGFDAALGLLKSLG